MSFTAAQVVKIIIEYAPRRGQVFWSMWIEGAGGASLDRIHGSSEHEYDFDLVGNASAALAYAAYIRQGTPAIVRIVNDADGGEHAETAAAHAALLAADANTAIKAPFQEMIDGNPFLRRFDPTNTEFSDVADATDSGGGGQTNTGVITTDLTLFQKSATEPAAPPSSLAYPHSGTDGWGNTNVSPWVIPSVTPPGADDLITWIAFARATSTNGSPFQRSPFVVAPFIPGATVQYSADGETWSYVVRTTGFQRVRTASGQWSAPILLNPLDAIRDALRGRIVFGLHSHIANDDRFQITPPFNLDDITELRAYWRRPRTKENATPGWTTQATPWTKAALFDIANYTPLATNTSLQPGITSGFFLSSPWGARIRVGQEHAVPSLSDGFDMAFNGTFTRAPNVFTGREVHYIEFPRITNTACGLMVIEVR